MITFLVLLAIVLALVIIATIAILACGASFIAVFGDLIVFGLIIWLLIRIFRRKRK